MILFYNFHIFDSPWFWESNDIKCVHFTLFHEQIWGFKPHYDTMRLWYKEDSMHMCLCAHHTCALRETKERQICSSTYDFVHMTKSYLHFWTKTALTSYDPFICHYRHKRSSYDAFRYDFLNAMRCCKLKPNYDNHSIKS